MRSSSGDVLRGYVLDQIAGDEVAAGEHHLAPLRACDSAPVPRQPLHKLEHQVERIRGEAVGAGSPL